MNYDAIRKAAANFDYLASDEREAPKAILGNKQLGLGLLYLAKTFGLPDIITMIAHDMINSDPISQRDATHSLKLLDMFYYRPEFRQQFPDKLMEFGAIKDRLAALLSA